MSRNTVAPPLRWPPDLRLLTLCFPDGRPNPDRTWTECFAQLVGTVLSLWDAAELDAAGEDGEVLPKFINLTDASIKMVRDTPHVPLPSRLTLNSFRLNHYLRDPATSSHCKTSSACPLPEGIATCSISIRDILYSNGRQQFACQCSSIRRSRRLTLAL